MVTPIVANVLVWKLILQPDGLLNGLSRTMFGFELPNFLVDANWAMISIVVMSVWAGMGYNMLVLTAALEQLPASVVEAAGSTARAAGASSSTSRFRSSHRRSSSRPS